MKLTVCSSRRWPNGLAVQIGKDMIMNSLTRWQRPELATWPESGRLTDLRDEIDRLFESPLAEWARSSDRKGHDYEQSDKMAKTRTSNVARVRATDRSTG